MARARTPVAPEVTANELLIVTAFTQEATAMPVPQQRPAPTFRFTPRAIEQLLDLIAVGEALVQLPPTNLGRSDVLTSTLLHVNQVTAFLTEPETERLPAEIVVAVAAYIHGRQGGHRFGDSAT